MRNRGENLVASNIAFFSKIFSHIASVKTVIEFGANLGLNLIAIRQLLPTAMLSAVEINEKAVSELDKLGFIDVHPTSILDFSPEGHEHDLALIKGVLIHINPDCLTQAYDILYKSSIRYICVAEYYNPSPVEISYRGHSGKLFKRDFAGEMLDRYPDLNLVEYGFVYHRDNHFPQDDLTWFILEKN